MFKLTVVTPKGIYFDKEVESLTIKLTTGYRTILTGHMALIGALDYAPMHIILDGETKYFAVSGGAINIKPDGSVSLLVNSIEAKEDLDLARAKAAQERALAKLAVKEITDDDYKRASLALKRAIARIKTFEM